MVPSLPAGKGCGEGRWLLLLILIFRCRQSMRWRCACVDLARVSAPARNAVVSFSSAVCAQARLLRTFGRVERQLKN